MKKIIAILCCGLLFIPSVAVSDWVEQMIGQYQAVGPSTFSGQQRGYVGFGSFGVRYPTKSDYLFSVEPPRITAGCGGIDIYLGSFSYLKPEYLVKKLERILRMAPAMAFQLALSTLCETCNNIMSTLEQIANFFNQLQLDECQASKALVAYTISNLAPSTQSKLQTEVDTVKSLQKGITDFWQGLTDKYKSSGNQPQTDVNDKLSDCPNNVKNLIKFSHGGSERKFLVQYLGDIKNWNSTSSVPNWAFISAVTGDIQKVSDSQNKDMSYVYLLPCVWKNVSESKALSQTKLQYRKTDGTCAEISGRTVADYVVASYNNLKTRVLNKQSLSSTDIQFLEMLPAPVYRTIVNAIVSQDPSIEEAIKKYLSEVYLVYILRFTERWINDAIANYKQNIDKTTASTTCQVDSYFTKLYEQLETLKNGIKETFAQFKLEEAEQKALARLNDELNSITNYIKYEQEVRNKFLSIILRQDIQQRKGEK